MEGMDGMMADREMPRSTAEAEETRDGARLVLHPKAPEQLGALRRSVQHRADRMSHGACPMM